MQSTFSSSTTTPKCGPPPSPFWPVRWIHAPRWRRSARCWWTIRENPPRNWAVCRPLAFGCRRRTALRWRWNSGAALMVRVYFIKAIRQIDERYGQFGSDADLAAEIRRASRKILLMPAASVRHHGRSNYTSMEWADFLSSRAVFFGKYEGFLAGIKARIAAVLGPLASFRLGVVKYTINGQKIDGTQQ